LFKELSLSRLKLLALALAALALGQALYAAWEQAWTYDEPFHLAWAERFLTTGVWERDSATRFNTKTPIMTPNVLFRSAARAMGLASTPDAGVAKWAARLPAAAWLTGILAGAYLLGRRVFGPEAGLLAAIGCALDPNLVAHGSLATVDAVYACAVLLSLAAGVHHLRTGSLASAIWLGGAFGLAFTAKFSGFLLLPTIAMAVFWPRSSQPRWGRRIALFLTSGLIATAVVACAYAFKGMAMPLATLHWRSPAFSTLSARLPWLRIPLPAPFLTGMDAALADERGEWNVLLLGRLHPHGVWYYFVALWLMKTPILLLGATLLGVARAIPRIRRDVAMALVAITFGVHFVYFSLLFRAQIGYRFVLACVPLLYLVAAAGIAPLLANRKAVAALLAGTAVALFENGLYLGNPLSFTNVAVWPKRDAFRLMADSNLDWGQNRDKIDRWLERSGIASSRLDPPHFLPGPNVFSANVLAGVSEFERHRFLRENAEPAGHYGHTYLRFDVGNELFDRYLDARRRLTPRSATSSDCPSDASAVRVAAGEQEDFSSPGVGEPRAWRVCVEALKLADLGLRSEAGQLRVAPYSASASCEGDLVGSGQVVWYRLEPGRYVFCAAEVPSRRPWIPHGFQARWLPRGHAVSIGLPEELVSASTPPPPEDSSPRSSFRPAAGAGSDR
jgi:4-amino-4-deoxy-L-arabinose transferase-like glycosyltransferase